MFDFRQNYVSWLFASRGLVVTREIDIACSNLKLIVEFPVKKMDFSNNKILTLE
jgi:hypothetical protein